MKIRYYLLGSVIPTVAAASMGLMQARHGDVTPDARLKRPQLTAVPREVSVYHDDARGSAPTASRVAAPGQAVRREQSVRAVGPAADAPGGASGGATRRPGTATVERRLQAAVIDLPGRERVRHQRRTLQTSAPLPGGAHTGVLRTSVRRAAPASLTRSLAPRTPFTLPLADGVWWAYMFDDFEADFPGYWILEGDPTWGLSTTRASEGTHSAWCAGSSLPAGGPYAADMDAWMVDGPFDLRNATAVEAYFDYWVQSEPNNDSLFVGLSRDGVNFDGNAYSGDSAGWVQDEKIVFDDYAGDTSVYIGVQFVSDSSPPTLEGAYIDYIELDAYIDSAASVDMIVSDPIVDDITNGTFSFEVYNAGPQALDPDTYAIDVYVDGLLDSSARNSQTLGWQSTVIWDWQLAYIYPTGVHTVRVEVLPDEGDIAPSNNVLTFTTLLVAPGLVDLEPRDVFQVDGARGTFSFEVYNDGPSTVPAGRYTVEVYVDNQFDSEAVSSLALGPAEGAIWDWTLGYIYAGGAHVVEIVVISDIPESDTDNNSITFALEVPRDLVVTDMRAKRPKVLDEVNDIFKFKLVNRGPNDLPADTYAVRVSVDGLPDSLAYNGVKLYVNDVAVWEWQLTYIYPPGLHTVRVEAMPTGADTVPSDNVLYFHMRRVGSGLQMEPIGVSTVVVGQACSLPMYAIEGTPPYAWSYASGPLPVGVDVSGEGGVYGTPATRGTFTFRVGALDSADAQVFANKTLVVIDPPGPQPVLAEQALPPAFLGTFYSSELTATGGVPPYAWSAPGGLPPGLSLMPDGTLSGTPTEWAIWEFPLRVSDTGAQSAEQLAQLRVRTDTEYLDAMVTKCRITIPWRDYRAGLQADDTIRVKARFQVAPGLVLDQYARLTVYVAGVPFSFAPPRRAKWRKYATFNRKVNGVARGTAKLTWKNNKDRVTVKAVLRDAALAAALERYGAVPNGSGQVIVPMQVVLNEHSSGILQVPLQQSSTPNGKGKLKTQ